MPALRRSKRIRNQEEGKKEPEEVLRETAPARKRKRTESKPEATKRKERTQRALNQRLYLISRRVDGEKYTFVVLGSTGNVYYLTFQGGERLKCSCFDARARKRNCKHILFILLRVLSVEPESPVLKRAPGRNTITKEELEEFLENAPAPVGTVEASDLVKQMYEATTGNTAGTKTTVKQREIGEDENCPICFEELDEDLVFCRYSCGKSVHKDCFERWTAIRTKKGGQANCVYCRAPWNPEKLKQRRANLAGYVSH